MKNMKKLMGAFILVFAVLVLCKPTAVFADGGYNIKIGTDEKKHVMGFTKAPLGFSLDKIRKYTDKGWALDPLSSSPIKMTFSNTKVVGKNQWGGYCLKNTGSVKVKIVYSLAKGETAATKKKVSQTFTLKVVKFECPFKKFSVNGNNLMSQVKMPKDQERYSSFFVNSKKLKSSNKLTYTMNKNWKVISVKRTTYDSETGASKVTNLKAKSGMILKKNANYEIVVKNSKTKATELYQSSLYIY